jgi:hypothetical protein
MKRFLTIAIAVAMVQVVQQSAVADIIVNSFGLAAPQNTVTFSELSFPSNTLITNQFQPFGVTLTPGHSYNSQGVANFPGITGDYVGVSNGIPFSIVFNGPVLEAAFGYAKNPTTVFVEALLNGTVIESFSQAVTFNNPNTAFLGFRNIVFNEIRVTADVTEGLVDNIQFNSVPEPGSFLVMSISAGAGLLISSRRRRVA